MSAPADPIAPAVLARAAIPAWTPLALGLLLMYVPSFYAMFTGLWATAEQAHGAIILVTSLWLLYRNRGPMMEAARGGRASALGWPLLLLGAALYWLGRAQDIPFFEIGSFPLTLAALLLLAYGPGALRAQWFALFFMLFMLPLPGALVDLLTLPMKTAVSVVVDKLLHAAGYPISRSGVILQIGQYQLLVADACAGLHTLFTLEALGLLYLNVVRHNALFRNVALALLIVPISFASNVIRVMALTLVTYHLGDAAGQGFLHGFAGMVLFVSALLLIIGADTLLRVPTAATAPPLFARPRAGDVAGAPAPAPALGVTLPAALLMAAVLAASAALRPTRMLADAAPKIVLAASVPVQFGDWKRDPEAVAVVPWAEKQQAMSQIYSQTLSRTYVNGAGARVMLAIAYGSNQTRQLRAHRQEVCYVAQGFQIDALRSENLRVDGVTVPATRMVASNGPRTEPVTYWFTMGSNVVRSYYDRQVVELRYALSGTIPDGYLLRVSTIGTDERAAFALQDAFVGDLMKSLSPPVRARLLGLRY